MDVSVKELKNRLSEYLKRVVAGEVVVVTSHGRPVARIEAISAGKRESEVAAINRLNTLPWVRPALGKPKGLAQLIHMEPGEKTLSDLLLEDRA